jgi:hypothetical protein
MAAKLNANQINVLRLAEAGRDLWCDVRGQAAHGGRQSTVYSLIRRGLIEYADHTHRVTDAGRAEMLAATKGSK